MIWISFAALAAACLGLLIAWRLTARRLETARRVASYERMVRQQILDSHRRQAQRLELAEAEIAHLRTEAELERRFAARMEEMAAAAAGPLIVLEGPAAYAETSATNTEIPEKPTRKPEPRSQALVCPRLDPRTGWNWGTASIFRISHDPEGAA